MKKIKSILSVLISSLLILSCAGKDYFSVKYFADIELDSRYSIIGRYEFDPEVTPRTHCYRITYDSLERPVLVQYLRAGKLGYGVFPYESVQTGITYYDDYEIREFLNAEGEPTRYYIRIPSTNVFEVSSIRLDLDESGNRIALTNLNIKGQPYRDTAEVVKYLWTLDNQGRIVKSVGINTDEDSVTESNWARERHYFYNDAGRMIEKRFLTRSGAPCQDPVGKTAIIRMKYDNDGNVSEELYYDIKGVLRTSGSLPFVSCRNTYNEWGQVTQKQYLKRKDGSDSILANSGSWNYKYDTRGNQVEYCIRDSLANIVVDSMTSIIRYVYDDNGNCIEEIKCNADGTPAILGGAEKKIQPIRRTTFNEHGYPIEMRLYNAEGNHSRDFWAFAIETTKYKFIDNGMRMDQAYLDPDGNPAPLDYRSDISSTQIEIDQYGRMTMMVSYDTLGNYKYGPSYISYDEENNICEDVDYYNTEKNRADPYGGIKRTSAYFDKYGYSLYELSFDSLDKLIDSTYKYDPERPNKNCWDEARVRADSVDSVEYEAYLRTLDIDR